MCRVCRPDLHSFAACDSADDHGVFPAAAQYPAQAVCPLGGGWTMNRGHGGPRNGGPGCFNLGSRFDLAEEPRASARAALPWTNLANRIMDSTIGGEPIAPPGSENLGHPARPVCYTGRLHILAHAPKEESR